MIFGDTLKLVPAGDNLWAAEADPNYAHPGGRFGGWTAGMLLKAAMSEPGDRGEPLSLTVLFTDAVNDGPVLIKTRLLRAGQRLQFWRAELSQGDKVRAHAQITFGVRRPTHGFTDAPMTSVPPPETEGMQSFSPPTKFGEQLEARGMWPIQFDGVIKPEPVRSLFWARHRFGYDLDHVLLTLFADFAPPRPMLRRGTFLMSSTVSMNVYFHGTPEEIGAIGPDYVFTEVDCRRCEGGYFDHALKLWSRDGVLLATSEQVGAFRD